jgi:hypothetical protein
LPIKRERAGGMVATIRCECGEEFQTPGEDEWRLVRCPACQRMLDVIEVNPVAAPEIAPLDEPGRPQTSGKEGIPWRS